MHRLRSIPVNITFNLVAGTKVIAIYRYITCILEVCCFLSALILCACRFPLHMCKKGQRIRCFEHCCNLSNKDPLYILKQKKTGPNFVILYLSIQLRYCSKKKKKCISNVRRTQNGNYWIISSYLEGLLNTGGKPRNYHEIVLT